MRIAAVQCDPTIGDIAGNLERLDRAASEAKGLGADVVFTSEMAVLGYPPRDLVLRAGVVERCEAAVAELAKRHPDLLMVIGTPRRVQRNGRRLANSLAICRDGRVEGFYDKRLLPTYDVFDEDRWFAPGDRTAVIDYKGERFGLLVCEDLWGATDVHARRDYSIDPVAETIAAGATALLLANATPFVLGKRARQSQRLTEIARHHRIPVLSCNQTGANDDLIFDGGSTLVDATGRIVESWPLFESCSRVVDLRGTSSPTPAAAREPERDVIVALVCGIRGYFRKTGHTRATIGLSGGIDSALVATLAAMALGPSAVTGVMMPSRYSSDGSVSDAKALAANLSLGRLLTLSISDLHDRFQAHLTGALGAFAGLPDENLQSRLRGVTVMAVSNADGSLVLSTGNKSEFAVGYATLYGDMVGGMAPIGDVLKTQVYDLSRFLNAHFASFGLRVPPIPPASLSKPPSAELRPDQTDQDSLPAYEDLDRVVTGWIEHEGDPNAISQATGLSVAMVARWCQSIDRAQFKRDQAPLVLKIAARTFGRGRPMPIAAQWQPLPK